MRHPKAIVFLLLFLPAVLTAQRPALSENVRKYVSTDTNLVAITGVTVIDGRGTPALLHEAGVLQLDAAFVHRAPAAAAVAALVEEEPTAVAAGLQAVERAVCQELDSGVDDRAQRIGQLGGRRPGPLHRGALAALRTREVRFQQRRALLVAQPVEQLGGGLVAVG